MRLHLWLISLAALCLVLGACSQEASSPVEKPLTPSSNSDPLECGIDWAWVDWSWSNSSKHVVFCPGDDGTNVLEDANDWIEISLDGTYCEDQHFRGTFNYEEMEGDDLQYSSYVTFQSYELFLRKDPPWKWVYKGPLNLDPEGGPAGFNHRFTTYDQCCPDDITEFRPESCMHGQLLLSWASPDFDRDGYVGLNDWATFTELFYNNEYDLIIDLIADGVENTADLGEFALHYGHGTPPAQSAVGGMTLEAQEQQVRLEIEKLAQEIEARRLRGQEPVRRAD